MEEKIFVIQEHWASRHHFDFRLEKDGVLKSWAIPRSIPQNAGEKRLAIEVEDHDLDYADFEGEITEGYGKGKVKIWEKGKLPKVMGRGKLKSGIEDITLPINGRKMRFCWN